MAQAIAHEASQSHARPSASSATTPSAPPSLLSLLSPVGQPHRSLLLFRFSLLNLLAAALLAASWQQGYVAKVLAADKTFLCVAIFAVFLAGLGICFQRAWQISTELDQLCSATGSTRPEHEGDTTASHPTVISSSNRLTLAHRISVVRHLANTLVLMGLIGTVLGFIIALSGVNPEQSADVSSIAPMVTMLIQGMSTALYTTLVGSILNVWLMANYQLLAGGTVQLMSALSDREDAREQR